MKEIRIMLDEGAKLPTRAHTTDAGLDIYAKERVKVPAMKLTDLNGYIGIYKEGSADIDTGVHVEIPEGYVGMLKSKSGLNVRFSLTGEGVIDSGYTGSIRVKLYNHSKKDYVFEKGDKLIQLVIMPIVTPTPVLVESFEETDRGNGGFGSTGR